VTVFLRNSNDVNIGVQDAMTIWRWRLYWWWHLR